MQKSFSLPYSERNNVNKRTKGKKTEKKGLLFEIEPFWHFFLARGKRLVK